MNVKPNVLVELGDFGGYAFTNGSPIENETSITWDISPIINPAKPYFVTKGLNTDHLDIYDMSDPDNIVLDNTLTLSTNMDNIAVQWGVFDPTGNWLYLHDGKTTLYAIFFLDPTSPIEFDSITVSDSTTSGKYALVKVGNNLYGAAINDDKNIDKIDVSTLAAPSLTSSTAMATALNGTNKDHMIVSPDSNYLLIGGFTSNATVIGTVDISGGTPAQDANISLPTSVNGACSSIGPPMFLNSNTLVIPVTDGTETFWLTYDEGTDWGDPDLASHAGGTFDPTSPIASGGDVLIEDPTDVSGIFLAGNKIFVAYDNDDAELPGYFLFHVVSSLNVGGIPDQVGRFPFPAECDVLNFHPSFRSDGSLGVVFTDFISTSTVFDGEIAFLVGGNESTGVSAYRDITSYVLKEPGISISYGIKGAGPTDLVATTGNCNFQVNNSASAPGGLLGEFSPDNTNVLDELKVGAQVRVTITYGGADWVWFGYVDVIEPVPGKHRSRRASIRCVDIFDSLSRANATGIKLKTDVSPETVFTTLLSFSKPLPQSFIANAIGEVYPYAFDRALEDVYSVTSELNSLALSERGYIYMDQGVLKFDGREVRGETYAAATSIDLTESDLFNMRVVHGKDVLFNRARVTVYPRDVDASDVVLFTLQDVPKVEPGKSITFNAKYVDPDQKAERVGALSISAPVATTDYTFNRFPGGGKNLTSNISISLEIGANATEVTVTNNGSKPGFLTFFQLKGKGLYTFEPVENVETDQDSIEEFGLSEITYPMEYQTDSQTAESAAEFLIETYSEPQTIVGSASITANLNDTLMTAFVDGSLAIGNRISITETVTGLSATEYFINSIGVKIFNNNIVRASYGLAPAAFVDPWVLGSSTQGILGTSSKLAPGFIV